MYGETEATGKFSSFSVVTSPQGADAGQGDGLPDPGSRRDGRIPWRCRRRHGDAPSPAPPELSGRQPVSFPPRQIAFRTFSPRPVEEHGSDRFSWLSYQQSAIPRWWESFLLLCGNLEHILGISPRTRLRSRAEQALTTSASGPQTRPVEYTRGPPHRESHNNSRTTSASVWERKYLTILGRFFVLKALNSFLPVVKYSFKDIFSSK